MKNIVLTFVNYFNFVACYFDHRFQLNTALGATQNVLFGNGKFIDAHHRKKDTSFKRHVSSSIEDLKTLFEKEKAMVDQLQKLSHNSTACPDINQYLETVDYNDRSHHTDYVLHPINAFNMIKRLSKNIEAVSMCFKNSPISEYDFSSLKNDLYHAASGITDMYEFNPFSLKHFIDGKLFVGNDKYMAQKKLQLDDLKMIATQAYRKGYLASYVDWLNVIIHRMEEEELSSDIKSRQRLLVKQAMKHHDKSFLNVDFESPESVAPPQLNDHAFEQTKEAIKVAKNKRRIREIYDSATTNFKESGGANIDLYSQTEALLRSKLKKLCNGTFERSPKLIKDLKCKLVCHENPFLKLGPFKVEFLHRRPDILVSHDFASEKDTNDIITVAKGRTKSTPYIENGVSKTFSRKRTSKVMYMNELLVPEAQKISRNIELLTKLYLKSDQYASENFQVMNYGIGGKISYHTDTLGLNFGNVYSSDIEKMMSKYGSSEGLDFGGPRLMTFMIYLTSVEIGGRTIFPQIGIANKPVKGSALLWFNMGSQNNQDSRINHLGCPVLHGNKWIANKWIKSLSNFKDYPCFVNKPHHSII